MQQTIVSQNVNCVSHNAWRYSLEAVSPLCQDVRFQKVVFPLLVKHLTSVKH